ncbi:hypothetical protein MBLNU230_g6264t1 [Neophaeotheca triangularis]
MSSLTEIAFMLVGALVAGHGSVAFPKLLDTLFTSFLLIPCLGLAACVVLRDNCTDTVCYFSVTKSTQYGTAFLSAFLLVGGLLCVFHLSNPTNMSDASDLDHRLVPESRPNFNRTPVSREHLPGSFPRTSFEIGNTPSACKELIGTGNPPDAESDNVLDKYMARSIPNERLVQAFKINSCFTSSDQQVCKTFRSKVEECLYVVDSKWIDFATAARANALTAFGNDSDVLSLFEVAQVITMKTMLMVLFEAGKYQPDLDDDIAALASEINHQWIRSKTKSEPDAIPPWAYEKQSTLRAAVKKVFPTWDETNNESNPFNFILPGYETMWRVVLRCFIEIAAREHPRAQTWKNVLASFLADPTKDKVSFEKGQGIAASYVSAEALRLYPPTRRVYRAYQSKTGEHGEVAADIEAVHHDPANWGPDPLVFRPERWDSKDPNNPAFLAFGSKPFNCPAKRWTNKEKLPFGVSMIALLVGALLEASGETWTVEGDFAAEIGPLDSGREAYKNVKLKKMH